MPMCILSIGTGMGDFIDIGHSRGKILKALGKMATNSQKTARELRERYRKTDHRYFRFNVERGLQGVNLSEWHKSDKISAHTGNYLAENARRLDACAKILLGHESTPTTAGTIFGQHPSRAPGFHAVALQTICHIPYPPNRHFLGRDEELRTLHRQLSGGKRPLGVIPVSVIHGMGGMGKTHLARQYAYTYRHAYDFVFWLPAETATGLAETFTHILRRISGAQADDGLNTPASLVFEKVSTVLEQTGMTTGHEL